MNAMLHPSRRRPLLSAAGHFAAAFTIVTLLNGCRSIGPQTVARDRFDYSVAITESWKRQTLLNIVKMRYIDPPIFVDVGQIVAGYQFESAVSLTGQTYPSGGGNGYLNGNLQGRFTDRPTITYTPLTGSKFISALITPIAPASIFQSIQSGWPADVMLKLGVSSINGLRNDDIAKSTDGPVDRRFQRVLELMRKIQDNGAVGIRLTINESKQTATLLSLPNIEASPLERSEASELRELLGLTREVNEFQLVSGSRAANDREIAVQSRSLMNVIAALSLRVDLPPEHLAAGLAMPSLSDPATASFHVYSSKTEPSGSFVSVRYRDHWFWIADHELASKRAFAFIMLLFTMSETSTNQPPPALTISAG
jgi:hypothetical protein